MTDDEANARVIGGHEPGGGRRCPPSRPQLRMSIVTAVIWVLLWGDLSRGQPGVRLPARAADHLGLPAAADRVPRPVPALAAHEADRASCCFDLVRSSFVVAAQAFHFGHTMRNAVVRVDLRSRAPTSTSR